MLYKNLCREEYLAELALHGLGMLEDSLIEFDLAHLLLELLVPGLNLGDGFTQGLVDLQDLLIILVLGMAPMVDCSQQSLMHDFVLLDLSL